jgi:hypothetical protein
MAPADVRVRLLGTAFAWLEGLEEGNDALLPTELTALSTKTGNIATGLPFATLAQLLEKHPQGFRRLLSLAPFVPSLVAAEQKVAAQAELLRVQRCVSMEETGDCSGSC